MKRVVIYNLKECFEDGLFFENLYDFEKRVQSDDYMGNIPLGSSYAKFLQAKINQHGECTLYYKYITNYENAQNQKPF